MVSESICLAILKFIHGRNFYCKVEFSKDVIQEHTDDDAANDSTIYCNLLGSYDLADIDSAMRWLILGGYVDEISATIRGPYWKKLTKKGCAAADSGIIPEEDRKLLYQEHDPYGVFIAHQFNDDDSDLVTYIKDKVLQPNGFTIYEGRAEGLEEFRHALLSKIRRARFFLCLLTKNQELAQGGYASSVWLYQETGVAVAYGKKPLLLVEEGIDSKFIGELQKTYEYESFTRSNHPQQFDKISRRLLVDLETNLIPLPKKITT